MTKYSAAESLLKRIMKLELLLWVVTFMDGGKLLGPLKVLRPKLWAVENLPHLSMEGSLQSNRSRKNIWVTFFSIMSHHHINFHIIQLLK